MKMQWDELNKEYLIGLSLKICIERGFDRNKGRGFGINIQRGFDKNKGRGFDGNIEKIFGVNVFEVEMLKSGKLVVDNAFFQYPRS